MVEGLLEHLEAHLGEIAGEWDTDPDGNELPFHIVHYAPGAGAGRDGDLLDARAQRLRAR